MSTVAAATMSTEDMIAHYQRSIEKSQSDPKRLLHCIGKLYRMRVTVQHLQATHVGRTINALRKDEGEVGVAAKSLVAKWKAMVAAEESSDCSEVDSDDEDEEIDEPAHPENNNERSKHEVPAQSAPSERVEYAASASASQHRDIEDDAERNQHRIRSAHVHRKSEHQSSNGSNGSRSHKSGSTNHHESNHKDGHRRDRSSHSDHRPSSLASVSGSHGSSHSAMPASGRGVGVPENCVMDFAEQMHNGILDMAGSDDIVDDGHDDHMAVDVNEHRREHRKRNGDTASSSKHHQSKSNHHERHEGSSSTHKTTDKHHHHHERSSSKSGSGHKSSSSRHGESSSTKTKSDDKSHRREHKSASKDNKSRDRSSSRHDSGSGSGKRRIDSSEEESHVKRQKCDKPSTSSSSSIGSPRKKSSKSSSSKPTQEVGIEIDQSMGTSFADALGMIAPSSSKSGKGQKPQASATSATYGIPSTSTGSSSLASSKPRSTTNSPRKSTETPTATPALLAAKVKLPPLEDLLVHLPPTTITNNYKPLPINPLIMDCVYPQEAKQPQRIMTDEEMFQSIATKNIRTKVYSGVKSGAIVPVPSLHELCIRVLQKNIDALEYTGGVPFEILRSVMERATPDQLFTLEHYNPYLMEDSDVLWQQHCNRKFRGHKRREMESWREMYSRCTTEQDHKLSILTENIKHSQTSAVPVKQTKLAYVDSMAKPPRSVIKKQVQFGTERKLVATPAARVSSLSGVSSNIAKVGDARLRTLATVRDTVQQAAVNPAALKGPKKAPLMAKTLQLMKGRFKR